jgi:rhodanese-related sulfurtransferase
MKNSLRIALSVFLLFQATLVSCQEGGSAEVKIVDKSAVTALLQKVETGEVQLLDVRTAAEFNKGAIPGAINLDIRGAEFKEQLGDFDTDKPIIIYCHSGGRSAKASGILESLGFTQIFDYKGGYSDWSR